MQQHILDAVFYLCLALRGWGRSSVKWCRLSDEKELSVHRREREKKKKRPVKNMRRETVSVL